jgi:hypothetical protein
MARPYHDHTEETITSTMSTPVVGIPTRTKLTPKSRRFYFVLSLFMTAMVLVGFWPSYFGQIQHGLPERPKVIHLHGAIFIGWMALLITQVILAARGRIRDHQRVGTVGIVYGCLVLVMGLTVSFAAPVLHVKAGEWSMNQAAAFLPVPLGDMVLFGGFFGAAVVYRRKPEIHKRLMLLATVALLFAAVARMAFLHDSLAVALPVWLSPLLLGIVYDAIRRRRVHPVYWVGLAVLIIAPLRFALAQSEAWLRIGNVVLKTFM